MQQCHVRFLRLNCQMQRYNRLRDRVILTQNGLLYISASPIKRHYVTYFLLPGPILTRPAWAGFKTRKREELKLCKFILENCNLKVSL